MRTFGILLLAIAVALADINFLNGNVTVRDATPFRYRESQVQVLNFPNVLSGIFFTQTATVNGTNQKDVVTGSFYSFANFPPTAAISFFDAFSKYAAVQQAGQQSITFDATAADTVVAKLFLSLEEVNKTNNGTVKTVNLGDLKWNLVNPQTTAPAAFLQLVTLKGTSANLGANFSVSISAVFSQVLGLLNVVGTPVITPASLQTVVNIVNFPYQNAANALRLNLLVGTGSATFTVQGSVTITSGNGTSANYVYISDKVQVDGNVKTATINVTAHTSNNLGVTTIDTQLTSKYSTQRTVTRVSVQFPAGAANIVFNPSLGAGPAPQALIAGTVAGTVNAGSSQMAPIFALLFLLAVLLL